MWAALAGAVITWVNRRKIILPVKLVLLLTGVYLLLSGALSAYPRQFDIIVPSLLLWLGYLFANLKTMSLKFTKSTDLDEIDLNKLAESKLIVNGRIL